MIARLEPAHDRTQGDAIGARRQRHQLGLEGLVKRAAEAINFRHAVWGPDEFFYGDLYASRPTGCGAMSSSI